MKTIGTMSGAALEHDARAAQVPHPSTRGLGMRFIYGFTGFKIQALGPIYTPRAPEHELFRGVWVLFLQKRLSA